MKPITKQIQRVETLLAKLSSQQWEEAVEQFDSPSPTFELVPSNTRLTGKAGISSVYQELATAIPDLTIEVQSALDNPGCSVREIVITGTHQGTYQGIEPSGRSIQLSCACFFHFDAQGLLRTERMYFDNQSLQRQMRGDVQPFLPKMLRIAA
ncbi:MAG: ester cyclase [Planctomycetes bacterium]|nr:ester cyclase [Planctomycetota bacterium]